MILTRVRALALALLIGCLPGTASAVNQLPTIAGPQGPVVATPVVEIGYDSVTSAPCVIGKTVTCVLSTTAGGGGGGGAVTVANGADVAEGSTTDAACAGDTTSGCTMQARIQRLAQRMTSVITALGSPFQAGGLANVQGNTASGASATENPLLDGCRAATATPTAVTDGQKVAQQCTVGGKRVVLPYAIPENSTSGAITTAMTVTTSTLLLAAPAAGLRNYITTLVCGNAHATVGTYVDLQDGNGGTVFFNVPAAPAYGGAAPPFPTPLRQPTTATALYVVNETTGASTKCSAAGFVAP